MHIKDLHFQDITIRDLTIQHQDSWCFYGANHSGIEQFLHLLTHCDNSGKVFTPALLPKAGIVSFTTLQDIYERELQLDNSDFQEYMDPGTKAKEFLPTDMQDHPLIEQLGMRGVLNTGYRQLSSGQTRKLFLLKEILEGKEEIVLHCPYDGLDRGSRTELDQILQQISKHVLLLVLVHNREDIPSWCTHLGFFKDQTLHSSGLRNSVLASIPNTTTKSLDIPIVSQDLPPETTVLVQLNNGFAGYGDLDLFSGLNLTINSGQHTLITGPNGCGKSTLLHLITGDHSKCYANDLSLFGKKRGHGESIWEIKKYMGIVSPELHRNHRIPGTALDVVISGIYDTIGLYTRATIEDKKRARMWINWLEMEQKSTTPFRKLTFAEQRMILIARGLIKVPRLLILDEPTQGLDEKHRYELLAIMEKIVKEELSTILFVSHREDEHRPFFSQRIALEKYATNDDNKSI